jgi:predicted DNA-binding protein (UPF0251 family)
MATGWKYPTKKCPTCGRKIASNQIARHRAKHDDPMSQIVATPEQMAEIVRLYSDMHLSMLEVAARTNWSHATIQRLLAIANVQRRPKHIVYHRRHVDNETLLKTAQLYGRGLSMDEIADLMDCARSTVCRRLHSVGAKVHKPGGRARARDRRTLV